MNRKNISMNKGMKCGIRAWGQTSTQNCRKLGKVILSLLLMMLLTAWMMPANLHAQTHPYSGVWYMKSYSNTNYYMVPAANPQVTATNHVNEDAYFSYDYNTTPGDPEMPFITTFQTGGDLNSIWIFVPVQGENNYYYIVHAKTGKYMKYYQYLIGNDARRKFVHLETVDMPGETEKFEITTLNTGVKIKPKNNTMYFNIAGGNQNRYNGGTSSPYYSGIIGGMSGTDSNSQFELTDASSAPALTPVISDVDGLTNSFSIISPATAFSTIHYTTDGTTPDANTITTINSGTPIFVTGNLSVQAIGVFGNFVTPIAGPKSLSPAQCATPVITVSNSMATITCPIAGASIFYTTDGTQVTTISTPYTNPFSTVGFEVIRAIATSPGFLESNEAFYYVFEEVSSSADITNMNGRYILREGFIPLTPIGTESEPFTGSIDGQLNTISGLDHPLVAYADGATIKNVILDNVNISSGENVGAICGEATGDSRIYNCGVLATGSTANTDENGYTFLTNCSSTISGSGFVGGVVGLLDGRSRVINCFSYANITGGNLVGGIVGKNNVATTASNPQTMVMNCMFYGDITGGTSKAPIYNGEIITNDGDADGVNNFNYFRSEASYVQDKQIDVYNCALAAETRFLQRFEFFRHLLNSNRALAAWWATGDRDNKDEMLKWVMEPDQIGTTTPYPILKTPGKYYSVVNYEPSSVMIDAENEHRNEGRKLGTLEVTIQMGSGDGYHPAQGATITKSDTTLIITDKDPAHFLFNYGKVQLPYYNQVGTNNYRKDSNGTSRVVTGWKITSITGGTTGSFNPTVSTAPNDAPNWNFADRNCTNKDLYSVSGRVFNQGAYWDVPEGVTAIIIEPYWAKCVYLADDYLDIVYRNGTFPGASKPDAMSSAVSVTQIGDGIHYTGGNDYNINGQNQKVYTTLASATTALSPSTGTVYDNAIVLVGNYHYYNHVNNGTIGNNAHSYTVMSADLDFDNEPDANLIMRFNGRTQTHPVRYDFLNLIGLGMAQKVTGPNSNGTYNFGIMQPRGWFEVTNTGLFRCTQFEYSCTNRTKKPIILQGGVVEQWVTVQEKAGDRVEYFHVGGNVWFKEFHRGTHQDQDQGAGNDVSSTPHPPISVTGGDFDEFYLTGLYQPKATITDDNAECYVNGGRFGVMAGAGMEGIGTTAGNGNVTWLIDNADINEFYGGGINASKPIFGNISTTISNSHVDSLFCGGPKFGDMENDRTVTTEATNCTFKTYFGAGYGGNSYNRQAPRNHNNLINFPHNDTQAGNDASWNAWVDRFYNRSYSSTYGGVSTQINYQFIPHSSNVDNVARLWIEYVAFSLATTHTVSSTLTDCTVTGNFYGGGSLGKVDVSVTSILDGCKVKGNVYGAGFSVNLPPVEVMNLGGFITEPHYDEQAGVFLNHVFPNTVTYTWQYRDEVNSTENAIDTDNHILYTQEDLGTLGTVLGTVTLTLKGNTTVGDGTAGTGNVFGGGEQSVVHGNTTVRLQGEANVLGNVYGGGDQGEVGGSASVVIEDEP